jgi:hypothetical protein
VDAESRDYPWLTTMNEVLEMTAEFVEGARQSQDDVTMGAYLKMASRSLRCALEIYGEHLSKGREMEQGEKNVPSDA